MTSNISPIIITTDDSIEAMRVDPSGKVGIGTTTPGASLEVAGTGAKFSGTIATETHTDANLYAGVLNSTPRIIFGGSTTHEIDNDGSRLRFFRPDIVDMVIDSSGNVGIGTTSPHNQLVIVSKASFGGNTSNTGSEPIEVQGSAAGVSFYDRTGGSTGRWVIYSERTGGAGTETLRFWSSNADKVTITQGGNVGISGSASVGGDLTFSGNLIGRYGDATKGDHYWLYARNTTTTLDVKLGQRQHLFALITLPGVRLGAAQPFSALAYIDSVDGQPFPNPIDPANSAWSGEAQTIRFGLTTSALEAWALAIVFRQQ